MGKYQYKQNFARRKIHDFSTFFLKNKSAAAHILPSAPDAAAPCGNGGLSALLLIAAAKVKKLPENKSKNEKNSYKLPPSY